MKFSEKRLNKIIKESIDKFLTEMDVVNNAPNGWTGWEETDKKNGLTPEEGKMKRMNPGNAAKSKGSIPTGNFSHPNTKEWKEKYPNMSYGEYSEKIYGVKLR